MQRGGAGEYVQPTGRFPANCVTTEPDAFFSKYFNITPPELCKKASKQDRNSDWQGNEISLTPKKLVEHTNKHNISALGRETVNRNNHPTVKPTDLMAWLVRLITPPGGIVLDPFAGSGSTLVAAKREGFQYIGIEREPEYCDIIRKRMAEKEGLT
jgi:site-specific DNA-methyltransferase (adenine-specific)